MLDMEGTCGGDPNISKKWCSGRKGESRVEEIPKDGVWNRSQSLI
jgi:hypothetical protein